MSQEAHTHGSTGHGQPSPNNDDNNNNNMMPYPGYQGGFAFPPLPQAMPSPGASMPPPMMGSPPSYHGMQSVMHKQQQRAEIGEHICTLHPPGMPAPFDVPFPERRLPVCNRCKKNFKSRELCRNRDGHKSLPWQNTYVAVTITDECLIGEGEDGSLSYNPDVPMVAELQGTPLLCLGPSDGSMRLEPICKVCREKNYTRDYCRNTCKHTTPPWSTTYVKLVVDGNMSHSNPLNKKRKKEENANGKPKEDPDASLNNEYNKDDDDEENLIEKSHDLSIIHESKTFLATISATKMTVKVSAMFWCCYTIIYV